MTEPVPRTSIEAIVGLPRMRYTHTGRAVSSENRFYILHSQECLTLYSDLTQCPYSRALDMGVTFDTEDAPQWLEIDNEGLIGCDFPVSD